MPRDHSVHLEDILEACRRIGDYTKGMDERDFGNSRITVDAVVRNLEVIGEAAGKIPEKMKVEAPDIEWRKIIGLRNVLGHEYFGINATIVWDVVRNKLEPLESSCRRLAKVR